MKWLKIPHVNKEQFKCYVMQWRLWGVQFSDKQNYECVLFDIIIVTRVGECKMSRKKRYITGEWPLRSNVQSFLFRSQLEKKSEQQLMTQRTLEDKRREMLTIESKFQLLQEEIQSSTSVTAQQTVVESNLKVSQSRSLTKLSRSLTYIVHVEQEHTQTMVSIDVSIMLPCRN